MTKNMATILLNAILNDEVMRSRLAQLMSNNGACEEVLEASTDCSATQDFPLDFFTENILSFDIL